MNVYKHEISDEETLELLETVYDVYSACEIANSYSETIGVAVDEYTGRRAINKRNLLLCLSRKLFSQSLIFPYVLRWKKQGNALLVKDVFCPNDFCVNDWKKYPELTGFVETKLVEASPLEIPPIPQKKNLIVPAKVREVVLEVKAKHGLETVDDALALILSKTSAMRLVVLLTRLIYDSVTLEELREFSGFGAFYFLLAYEHDDKYIKIVHEFFPYNYDMEFVKYVR